jgi:serine/threonine protein kinase
MMSSPAVSTPQSKPLIGEHFELGEFINQGGMGAVYRGRDKRTGQPVAIKHLKQEVIGADNGLIERFVREGEALRALNHPNIVKLLGADTQDTGHYLVMEYVAGGSLAELLSRSGKLSVERTVRIGLELSDALARAHYLRIIHRDLKPANILLTEDGTPRLTDFGVAHVADSDMTGTGMIIGTFAYLPPRRWQRL